MIISTLKYHLRLDIGMRTCKDCGETKSESEFYKRWSGNGYFYLSYCKPCQIARAKIPAKVFDYHRRTEAIRMLGGKCVNCGETDRRVLQINHLNGGGRAETVGNSYKFINRILSGERKIDDLDIRCANCNILYEYERGTRTQWDKLSKEELIARKLLGR